MKLVGQCLVWLSLAAGAVSSATAYLVSLDLADERILGLTFAAPAGKQELANGSVEPMAVKDQQVTTELLAGLRDAGVRNIRVKEFAFGRWRGKWAFLLALAGLAAGGLLVKRSRPLGGEKADEMKAGHSPSGLLDSLRKDLQGLHVELSKLSDEAARCKLVVHRVGGYQRNEIPAIIDTRGAIVAEQGLAAFASLMDSFAGAERQLNRAWSAAVDRDGDEAAVCLDAAIELLDETAANLGEVRSADARSPGDRS